MTKFAIHSLLLLSACTPGKPAYALAEYFAQANNGSHQVNIAATIAAAEAEMKKNDISALSFGEIIQKSVAVKDGNERADILYRWLLQTGKELSAGELSVVTFVTAFGKVPSAKELALIENTMKEMRNE